MKRKNLFDAIPNFCSTKSRSCRGKDFVGKKGSHVGMMLSFVIFVTFIVFLYSVLSPAIKIGQDKKLILDNLILELVEMLNSNYIGGSIKTLDENFVAINQLANSYNSNYKDLKTDLKISEADEFGFSFIDEEGIEIVAEKNVPTSVNVYAKKIPVYYVGEEKNILLGFIILKVW